MLVVLPCMAAASTLEDTDRLRGVIGILPLPEVFGKEPCDRFQGEEIPVFSSPVSAAPFARIFVARPWVFPPDGGGCEGLEVAVSYFAPGRGDQKLPSLEFAYENPGAIVVGRQGEWFEIRLAEGSAWVRIPDGNRFHPVQELLMGSLASLTGHAVLYENPRDSKIVWSPGPEVGELPVEVLSYQTVAGRLWVQVSLLAVEPCSREDTHLPQVTGWMPFHGSDGIPAIWFFPRGC